MTALSEFRKKASEKYTPFPLELEDGTALTLKSILQLDKEELRLFNVSSKKLAALDDEEDLEALREEFVSILSGVCSNKQALADALEGESIGTLVTIFEYYAGALSDGAKSKGNE